MKWIQLLNGSADTEDIAATYGIHLFPTKLLIDPGGMIILNSSDEGQAFYVKLGEVLKKQN